MLNIVLFAFIIIILRNIWYPCWIVFDLLANQNVALLFALVFRQVLAGLHERCARLLRVYYKLFMVIVASRSSVYWLTGALAKERRLSEPQFLAKIAPRIALDAFFVLVCFMVRLDARVRILVWIRQILGLIVQVLALVRNGGEAELGRDLRRRPKIQ